MPSLNPRGVLDGLVAKAYFPGRKIVAVSLEAEEGAIRPVVELCSRLGIGLLSMIVQTHPGRGSTSITVFLDLTSVMINGSTLLREIRRLPEVRHAEMVDLPLTHGEARLVAFTLADMDRLFSLLREAGSGGLAIMYHMGFRAGQALADKIGSYYGDGLRATRHMLLYYESLGHGRYVLKEYFEGRRCRVVVEELVECVNSKTGAPSSQLFRGVLAGFLSELWGKKVDVKEVKCVAAGDPHCEFLAEAKTR